MTTTAQGWALLGLVGGLLTLLVTLLLAQGRSLRQYLDARFDRVDARFETVDARFEAVEARLGARVDGVEARLGARMDVLDRDVQALADRVFRRDGG